jgi:hypothetical protein
MKIAKKFRKHAALKLRYFIIPSISIIRRFFETQISNIEREVYLIIKSYRNYYDYKETCDILCINCCLVERRKSGMTKFKRSDIENLQSGQDIYDAMETAAQPDMIQVCQKKTNVCIKFQVTLKHIKQYVC